MKLPFRPRSFRPVPSYEENSGLLRNASGPASGRICRGSSAPRIVGEGGITPTLSGYPRTNSPASTTWFADFRVFQCGAPRMIGCETPSTNPKGSLGGDQLRCAGFLLSGNGVSVRLNTFV